MNKNMVLKILVPVIIAFAVGAMWIVKNNSDNITEFAQNVQVELSESLKDADFSFEETEKINFDEFTKYGLPIIADYGSESCGPCRQMKPDLVKVHGDMIGKAFIKYTDVWKYRDAGTNVPLQVIPTQVFINSDGTPFVPSEELASEIQFKMYNNKNTNEHAMTVHEGALTEEQMLRILKEMGVE